MPSAALRWTTVAPVAALLLTVLFWGRYPPDLVLVGLALVLIVAVLSAVHHAEVVAHRIGEPFGSLVLAIAVTVIEVGLILTLMLSGSGDTSTLARDTVFSAVMISLNGIVGLVLVVSALKHHLAVFNPEGTGSALATVIALATLCLVLPSFTTSELGPVYSASQFAFAAVASVVLYGLFVFTQTVRHRDFFLPVNADGSTVGRGEPGHDADGDGHADPPSDKDAWLSFALLLAALVAVVGLAKTVSPLIEEGVEAVGFPQAVVGVVIALTVLAPETIAAVRAASRERVQIGLNLANGSAMASIGLTIPTLAVATIWLDDEIALGLEPTQLVLLFCTAVVAILTVVPGRAKPLNGGVHLVLLAAYIFLTISP